VIDRARRIAVVVHALEHSLHPLGAGAVNRNPRITGRTCPSSRYRAVAIVFADFVRARRLFLDTAAFGQSAANSTDGRCATVETFPST
jgi:hypothetical protein